VEEHRPGPKPKRLYVRVVRAPAAQRGEAPDRRALRGFSQNLERVGRLVAEGTLTRPAGSCLVFRATDLAEAERILRGDPWKGVPDSTYEVLEWDPREFGGGVNLDPAPARGSGRLTLLHRIAVVVSDQARAVAWYRDVLGLRVREEDPDTGYVELSLGRGAAGLNLVAPRREWGEPYYTETRARIGRATGIVFQTDSVNALELRLRHAGAPVTEAPRAQPWGGVTIRFSDPDGNEFLAFQPEITGSTGGPLGARRASAVASARRASPRAGPN
jgi:catechol 2,3-dioxygenase-like lactoylglutathione lyase family enzyme